MGKNVRSVTLWIFASTGVTGNEKTRLEDNIIAF